MSPLMSQGYPQPHNNSNIKSGKKKQPIQNSPYHKAMKEFDTYGKAEKKKTIQNR